MKTTNKRGPLRPGDRARQPTDETNKPIVAQVCYYVKTQRHGRLSVRRLGNYIAICAPIQDDQRAVLLPLTADEAAQLRDALLVRAAWQCMVDCRAYGALVVHRYGAHADILYINRWNMRESLLHLRSGEARQLALAIRLALTGELAVPAQPGGDWERDRAGRKWAASLAVQWLSNERA